MKISFLIQNIDHKNIHFSLEIDDDATILQLKELLEATEYGDKSFNLELIFGDLNVKMSDSSPFKFYHPGYYTGNHAITLPNYEQSSLMNKRAGRQLVEVDNQMSLLSKKNL